MAARGEGGKGQRSICCRNRYRQTGQDPDWTRTCLGEHQRKLHGAPVTPSQHLETQLGAFPEVGTKPGTNGSAGLAERAATVPSPHPYPRGNSSCLCRFWFISSCRSSIVFTMRHLPPSC